MTGDGGGGRDFVPSPSWTLVSWGASTRKYLLDLGLQMLGNRLRALNSSCRTLLRVAINSFGLGSKMSHNPRVVEFALDD